LPKSIPHISKIKMTHLTFDECRSRAGDALSRLEGYSNSKEDLQRCLRDWYDRGNNYCLIRQDIRHTYRRMPKKPWATREWVSVRDVKLYKFMMDNLSNLFWEGVWGYGHSLIPCSPKFKCIHDIDETLRAEKFYALCHLEIERTNFNN